MCQKENAPLMVDKERYAAWQNRNMLVQDAFPHLTAGQRETLVTGICEPCWDDMFKPKTPSVGIDPKYLSIREIFERIQAADDANAINELATAGLARLKWLDDRGIGTGEPTEAQHLVDDLLTLYEFEPTRTPTGLVWCQDDRTFHDHESLYEELLKQITARRRLQPTTFKRKQQQKA